MGILRSRGVRSLTGATDRSPRSEFSGDRRVGRVGRDGSFRAVQDGRDGQSVSISAELRQQVSGAIELSSEARGMVDEAAELMDSATARLTAALAASHDPQAALAVRSFAEVRERLGEITGLLS